MSTTYPGTQPKTLLGRHRINEQAIIDGLPAGLGDQPAEQTGGHDPAVHHGTPTAHRADRPA